MQLATLKPGETTHDFVVKLPKGEYNLWFYAWAAGGYAGTYFDSGRKMLIGYGADANKVQVGNLKFDGQTGTALEVKSVNGALSEELKGSFDVTNSLATLSITPIILMWNLVVAQRLMPMLRFPFLWKKERQPFRSVLVWSAALTLGTTYKVRLYTKDGSTETNIGDAKNLTLQPYFRYWKADADVTVKEANYYWKIVGRRHKDG